MRGVDDALLLRTREPMRLHGTALRLFIAQTIRVEDDRVAVQSYAYRIQEHETRDSWLVRWEYFRHLPTPEYAYPLAHMHVNGAFASPTASAYLAKSAANLHLPTRRVPLELVLWHLIAEWGVASKTDAWQSTLQASIDGFSERQRAP